VSNVIAVLVVVLLAVAVAHVVRQRRSSLVPKRGMSIGADLGGLADAPQVRVTALTRTAPDRLRVVFTPEPGSTAVGLDVVVALEEDAFGASVLDDWQRSGSPIALVVPPDSHLLRLRSVDSLQHLTLRRVDEA
jgi:hypothetical protein